MRGCSVYLRVVSVLSRLSRFLFMCVLLCLCCRCFAMCVCVFVLNVGVLVCLSAFSVYVDVSFFEFMRLLWFAVFVCAC